MSAAPTILYCIGAQKAGTSWLHEYLLAHPDVHVPAVKEMHYFDAMYGNEGKGVVRRRAKQLARLIGQDGSLDTPMRSDETIPYPSAEYHAALVYMHTDRSRDHNAYRTLLLNGWTGEAVVADITPSYATLGPEGFSEMRRIAPAARFLFIMRDPLKRLVSALRMLHASKVRPRKTEVGIDSLCEDYLAGRLPGAVRRTQYSATVRDLESVVPAGQIAYLFYETMFDQATMDWLTSWLGIRQMPADFGKVVWGGEGRAMPSTEMIARLHDSLADEYDALAHRFGAEIPDVWGAPEQRSTA